MAIYIPIEKVFENELYVEYIFAKDRLDEDEGLCGRLRVNKSDGHIDLIHPLLSPDADAVFARVAYKIKKHLKSGELSDKTCWAT